MFIIEQLKAAGIRASGEVVFNHYATQEFNIFAIVLCAAMIFLLILLLAFDR